MNFSQYFSELYLVSEANVEARKEFLKAKYQNKFPFFKHFIPRGRFFDESVIERMQSIVNVTIGHPFNEKDIQHIKHTVKNITGSVFGSMNMNDSELERIEIEINNIVKNYYIDKIVDVIDPTHGKYSDWIMKCLSSYVIFKRKNDRFGGIAYYHMVGSFYREDGQARINPLLQLYERHKSELKKINRKIILTYNMDDSQAYFTVSEMNDINKFTSIAMFEEFAEKVPEIFADKIDEEKIKAAEKEVDKFIILKIGLY